MADLPPSYAAASPTDTNGVDTTTRPTPVHLASVAGSSAVEELPDYDGEMLPAFIASRYINEGLPPTFHVNDTYTQPLVLPSDLQAHLVLMGAFHRLREEVRTLKAKSDVPMEPDAKWAVFLQRAVYRFECWVTRMIGDDPDREQPAGRLAPEEIPPLDVMMCWHTYMLNPRTYYDDCIRRHQGLHKIGSFPLLQLCSSIDPETLLPQPASQARVTAFTSLTGQTFEPPVYSTTEDQVTVYCPNCSFTILVPWITQIGDGYAQRGFLTECSECQMKFDREAICVRRFWEDVERCTVDPEKHVLANTSVDYLLGIPKESLGLRLTALILRLTENRTPRRPEDLGRTIGWRFADIEGYCRKGFLAKRDKPAIQTPRGLNIVLSAYRQPESFSVDLPSAILRQMNFIEKIVSFGWAEDGRFDEDNETLTRAVVRYHAWLDLMHSMHGKFVVPTLEIDLCWHTHQLFCVSYRRLYDIIGLVPDHDDKVTQGALSEAFDDTAEAWKTRFGVPYTVCGCLPPSAKFDNAASSALSRLSFKGKAKATFNNPRPDLVSIEDTSAEETHPSDHNAVAIINPREENAAQAQLRRREMETRATDLNRKVDRGVGGDFARLQAKRISEHSQAFLAPVDYGAKQPFGVHGHGDCAVYSGAGIKGEFGAGECAKGNGNAGLCGVLTEHPRSGLRESVDYATIMSGDRRAMTHYGISRGTMAYGLGAGGYDPTVNGFGVIQTGRAGH